MNSTLGAVKKATIHVWIITLSDRAYEGTYEDRCGPMMAGRLSDFGRGQQQCLEIRRMLLNDDPTRFRTALLQARRDGVDVVLSTGGTGIAPRDKAPEVVTALADTLIPGIMEGIRVKYGMQNPLAWLSRSVAAKMGRTLVFTLPGSPRAVTEYLDEILPLLPHMLSLVQGRDPHLSQVEDYPGFQL